MELRRTGSGPPPLGGGPKRRSGRLREGGPLADLYDLEGLAHEHLRLGAFVSGRSWTGQSDGFGANEASAAAISPTSSIVPSAIAITNP